MKQRFSTEKKNTYVRNILISSSVFLAVFLCFFLGTSALSERTEKEEMTTLQSAITRGVIRCYSIEGIYPESLDYLKENYGLYYDEDKYFVDYQPVGANIMPDVTIIRKEASK